VLAVEDNGLGLSAKQQEKLFSMFRRFHDHVEGSGVGLYMVKRIMDNAGGKIEVDSQLGAGSTFRIYFPKATLAAGKPG
jgi:signal transduction histidine kinase